MEVDELRELPEVIRAQTETGRPMVPVGLGTNIVFGDGVLPATLVRFVGSEIRVLDEGAGWTWVRAQAGVVWDDLVAIAVREGLSGLEHLSGIPGTVGAAPVNNIGALGYDVSRVLQEIHAVDLRTGRAIRLSREECRFGYRRSIFTRQPGRALVTEVVFRLPRDRECLVRPLPNLVPYISGLPRRVPLEQVRDAIIASRAVRIPSPEIRPNCGSFFVNPWASRRASARLMAQWPALPVVPESGGYRLRAGWMLDAVGAKALTSGGAGVDGRNAMVIVNLGTADFADVCRLARELRRRVRARFGVTLRQEPMAVTVASLGRWRS